MAGDFELFGQVTASQTARERLREFARTVFGRELPDNVQVMMVSSAIQFQSTVGRISRRAVNGGTVVSNRGAIIFLTEAGLNNPVVLADEIGHLLVRGTNSNFHHRVTFRLLDRAVRRGALQLTDEQRADLLAALGSAAVGN